MLALTSVVNRISCAKNGHNAKCALVVVIERVSWPSLKRDWVYFVLLLVVDT